MSCSSKGWISAGVTVCVGLVLLPAVAGAAVQAPGFSGGPGVVSDGLLWARGATGQASVFLSTATSTRLLVTDTELSAVHVEDGWVIVAEASGPKIGKLGRRLTTIRGLRRCPPIRSIRVNNRLEAVANDDLYAVVRASCFGRRQGDAQLLVRVRLGTGDLHVIAKVPSGAISLAAAGSRLALTYEVGAAPTYEIFESEREGSVRVKVLDSRNGHLLYSLAPPSAEHGEPGRYSETQLDTKGDVLVTSFRHRPLPGGGEAIGWWGSPRTRIARPLESGFEPSLGERLAYASLSNGRVAYATRGEGQTRLEVLNLATGEARTIVTFSGAVNMEGFGLGTTFLAWAQQNYAYITRPCVTEAPVGSPELTETPLSPAGQPVAVEISPGPRPAGQICPPPR
ncbi:MAG TPA: hypothetical protein VGI24_07290 [Solirubrobacteraceae bacterium]